MVDLTTTGGEVQSDGAPGQAGHGGGGERHGREEEKLAEDGGAEDEHGEGGGLAGCHYRPAAHPERKILGTIGDKICTCELEEFICYVSGEIIF